MADQMQISGPVTLASASKEMVAFKLLEKIAQYESDKVEDKANRAYWLTLYRQCWKATNGGNLEFVLKRD